MIEAIASDSSRRTKIAARRPYMMPIVCIAAAFPAGCAPSSGPTEWDDPPLSVHSGPSGDLDAVQDDWVEETLAGMSVDDMAAQVIVAWIPGSYVSTDGEEFDEAVELVERGVGGLWMMGGLPHARTAKVNALQAHAKVPMFISGGGLGRRTFAPERDAWMLGGGTDVPPELAYGAVGDPAAVREACRIVGVEGRVTGVNANMDADLANVLTNFDNVLIGRVYGDDPTQVGRLAAACVQGSHDAGLLATAGFFPGAGGLGDDPHVRLPILTVDRDHLDSVELVPFQAAIEAGTDLVMTSHFAVPALTGSDSLPATLAPEVIRVLREELGFQGLVLTDAFAMGALTNNYDHIDATMRAFLAGHDLLLGPYPFMVADTLAARVLRGEIPLERLQATVRRILKAKARLGLHQTRPLDLEAVAQTVGRRAHQQTADADAQRSIVLLRDRDGVVPLADPSSLRVLSVTLAREDNEIAGGGFDQVLREHGTNVATRRVSPGSSAPDYRVLETLAEGFDAVVLSVYLEPMLYTGHVPLPDEFARLMLYLQEQGHPFVVVSFGKLRILDSAPSLGTFVLAWSGQEVMQRAAARALVGAAPITGRMPVALPPHHRTGEGLDRP